MSLNIELGVLIQGGRLPAKVAAQFGRLVEASVLQSIAASGQTCVSVLRTRRCHDG